jgi:sulfide dehydrogenase cytochrome subunit
MRTKGVLLSSALVCLVAGSANANGENYSKALSWNCSGCHGPDGVSAGPTVPSIAGMDPRYFFTLMRGFKLDERYSTIMSRIAKGYGNAELRAMGEYFAASAWENADATASIEALEAGRAIHDELCAECHDDEGRFQDKEVPRLAGQWPDYLLSQLIDYQNAAIQMPQPDKMKERLTDLSLEDLKAVSSFYGSVGDNGGESDASR